ncbi:YcxB family protein [Kitasatospora sp. NPDC087315]|uniref:YcxB family protein n=1 Tax=Kitasatospora sp. NPDC087315 TaxID=3364069 RepID=UPI003821F2DA
MGEDQRTGTRLELSYRPTAEDFREALTARAKISATGRRTRWLLTVAAVCAVVGSVLSVTSGEGVSSSLVVMLLVTLLLLALPWLQARQFHRLTEGKGEYRAVVDDSGVTVSTEQSSSTLTWQAAPRFVETPRLFVLLSGDRNASCLTLLPKRGIAEGADVDRLRAVLERHLSRAGKP